MAALLLLGLGSLLAQPYDPQSWSVFAAKWVVPFALYYLAGSVFDNPASLRRFETFTLVVLGYLCLIAILFLFGAKELIFPALHSRRKSWHSRRSRPRTVSASGGEWSNV